MIFYRTFEHGLAPVWSAITEPNAVHAFWLSLEIVAIAVPLNTIFGVGMALLLERGKFKGKVLLGMLIDLPFAISPVVVGLALVLVYGKTGWFGNWLIGHGIQVIFSVPGMVIATAVVSLPFVARETTPVLRELGTDAEQAAATLGASGWQTFWRITLPAIRWGVVYGVVLTTARALGRVRRGQRRLRPDRGPDADAAAVRAGPVRELRRHRRLHRRRGARAAGAGYPHTDEPSDPTHSSRGRLSRMAIEALNVSKRFGDFVALDDVCIRVDDGSLTALLGPSGSGKSTLLRIIAGLETPDSGSVIIDEQEITSTPARSRGVGFVFQHYAPFKHMTVYDNVAFGLTVRKRPKAEIGPRVQELLGLVRLDGLAERYPSQLSGGQLQRMALGAGSGGAAAGTAFGRAVRRARRAGPRASCASGCAGCTRRFT